MVEGQTLILEPGQSWLVPPNASHSYRVLGDRAFEAVEFCSPPPASS